MKLRLKTCNWSEPSWTSSKCLLGIQMYYTYIKRLLKARVSPNGTTFARSYMHDIHNKCCVCIKYFVTNYQVCNVMCESSFFHQEIQQNVALDHKEISNYFCFLISISILLDMETRKKNDCWLMENMYLRNNCT